MTVGEVFKKVNIATNLRRRLEDKGADMNQDDEIMIDIIDDYLETIYNLKIAK